MGAMFSGDVEDLHLRDEFLLEGSLENDKDQTELTFSVLSACTLSSPLQLTLLKSDLRSATLLCRTFSLASSLATFSRRALHHKLE